MQNEELTPRGKGVLRKIRWKSQESIILTFLEWLIPWRWLRIVAKGIFILLVTGMILLWLMEISGTLIDLADKVQSVF
ncbi:hypothetical protein AAII07_12955 [Microvirga sp. 0TCS3.31]